ncbi:MAG: hypothetical protein P8H62_08575 [Henriciella sp.]|nr:hypothetical protein [Henriciella sp.]
MSFALKTMLTTALIGALAAGSVAQPLVQMGDTYGIAGLEHERSSAVSVRLVMPFGNDADQHSVSNQTRLGLAFAPDWRANEKWSDQRTTSLGVTFDGRLYSDIGSETLSIEQVSMMMGVDADEKAKGNNTALWLVGGLVVVGVIALAADTAQDNIRECISDSNC